MKKLIVAVCACVACLVIAGCFGGAPSVKGVGIVDLDRVAQTLGWLDEMTATLKTDEANLRSQVEALAQNGARAIQDAKKKVAGEAKLSEEKTKDLEKVKEMRELDNLGLTQAQKDEIVNAVGKANADLQQANNHTW